MGAGVFGLASENPIDVHPRFRKAVSAARRDRSARCDAAYHRPFRLGARRWAKWEPRNRLGPRFVPKRLPDQGSNEGSGLTASGNGCFGSTGVIPTAFELRDPDPPLFSSALPALSCQPDENFLRLAVENLLAVGRVSRLIASMQRCAPPSSMRQVVRAPVGPRRAPF
jgi:hypothetical protein